MYVLRVFLTFGLFWSLNSYAASFDCGNAVGKVEKAICDDSELSALDEVLARTYKLVLRDSANSDPLRKEQKQWLTATRKRCADADCLTHAYEQRISRLETIWTENNITLNRAFSNSEGHSEKPFEGQWRDCQLWKGDEICSSYLLLQSGRHVCGEWEYWATYRTYSGRIVALARNQTQAEPKWICGTVGSESNTECKSEYKPNGGWEEAHGHFQICNDKLYQSDAGVLCGKLLQSNGFMRWPLPKNSRESLSGQPWIKSCLDSGIPNN